MHQPLVEEFSQFVVTSTRLDACIQELPKELGPCMTWLKEVLYNGWIILYQRYIADKPGVFL